ncbi:MAG: LUD domain-containing protein [Chthoniobacteraceae bacterium]
MSERAAIFGRIREALKILAPIPGQHTHEAITAHAPISEPEKHIAEWLPAVGASAEQHLALYAVNSAELKTDFRVVASREEMQAQLAQIAAEEGWKKVALHTGELTTPVVQSLGLPTLETVAGYDKVELEKCDAGITACDALVAQTGSVLVSSRSAGGRALSVLPAHHVVLARKEQLLADLPAAFALLKQKYDGNYPSFFSFITGPSRTGDIERILVLGAHGPKKLTVLLW